MPEGSLVYLHFEAHDETNELKIGQSWFEPVPASAVTLRVERVRLMTRGGRRAGMGWWCRVSRVTVCCVGVGEGLRE